MIYNFECYCKGAVPLTKEINVPVSEHYIPLCPNCERPMKQVFCTNFGVGCLDKNNLPK